MIQHARRFALSIGLAAALGLGMAASPALAQAPYLSLIPQNSSKYAAIVVDARSGEVLYGKRADAPRYPASITKVMTLYLAFEALASGKLELDEPVVFSPRAAAQSPTKLGIRAGDSITVHQAMQGMVTRSANDAAVALAEKIGGTEQRFAALMTLRAQELGMSATTFANASGLPDSRQITTARDIAVLSRAVMRDYPQYYRLFSTKNFEFRGQAIRNHNGLLYRMDGVDGLKTGFTNASGYNLMASAERGGRRVIAIMLGGKTGKSRDAHVRDLIEAAFLEIGGGVVSDDDLRTQIAFGERGNVSADDLALAQLRRLQEPDAALVASLDNDAFADAIGTTEEGEESLLEEVSEGDGEGHDPIGDLIEASPAPAPAPTAELSATPVATPITTVAAEDAILVTSEARSGAPAQALDLLDQPTAP